MATLEQIVVADCDGASAYHLWNTYFTPEMLSAELAAAGFDTLVFAGDVAGASASSDSQTLAVVAQAHNQA
ncbi:hypothetical protein [Gordonibacter sp.]|uniref:hypothetical protein n=1 Tax=Gordonibacter sp. TaxID=1968902 RepID=UPI0025BB6BCB|nr:hypothetical protein [Gordonibacter sp.]